MSYTAALIYGGAHLCLILYGQGFDDSRRFHAGQTRLIPIYEMDAEPLAGMSLMYGYELVLPVLDGATFILRRLVNP